MKKARNRGGETLRETPQLYDEKSGSTGGVCVQEDFRNYGKKSEGKRRQTRCRPGTNKKNSYCPSTVVS
ncbi:hypothetical protein TGPRC2_214787 [Toxoplasma gondii TgCatPRC2]|uniref:Uncharacterized protein n=1 Tax=Toxoplasma gondii TgCatPRC2 TaxID=1130821 RepID=A0A151HF89_TOXGO|nr:hypothetical protein TGPRC2_214787 [Toxoplasma gondii TgCatPRC2]